MRNLLSKIIYWKHVFFEFVCVRLQALIYRHRIFLIGTPWYGNIGDQAIAVGELKALKVLYPKSAIIDVTQSVYRSSLNKWFGLGITKNDVLFLQGGGNLGSLYPQEEVLRRSIITSYNYNKIIVMPVSIFFHKDETGRKELKKSVEVYQSAHNLTILCRDPVSFAFAKSHFESAHIVLTPDIVTTLRVTTVKTIKRQGVLFFLRSDKEKVCSDAIIQALKERLKELRIEYRETDNLVDYNIYPRFREAAIKKQLNIVSSSKLIVTDRFHGLIFAVITNTPVLVLKSLDSKITSGIRWFKDLPWVMYSERQSFDDYKKFIETYVISESIITKKSNCGEKFLDIMRAIGLGERA